MLGLISAPALADLKQTLDWVPLEQLTEQQRQQLTPGSCGAYISPIQADPNAPSLDNAPLETSSNQSNIEDNNGYQKVTLIGDVIVRQGHRQLTADQAIYDEEAGSITIDGALTVREPNLLLMADRGTIKRNEDTLIIDNATYVIHSAHIRGSSTRLAKEGEVIQLEGGEFTQCAPGNNDWALRGSKIVINTESRQGVATHVRLVVKNIPVFYWPYLRFPVGDERMSGFLYPVIQSSDGDIDLSVPYYFNLAPNYDLTLTPHFLQRHGTLFEANGRHLSRAFDTKVTVAHLSNDKGQLSDSEQSLITNGTKTAAEVNRFKDQDRWLVNIDQTGGRGQRWFSFIDYNEVSDIDYLDDFDASTLNRNSDVSLKQQFKVGYNFRHWDLTVNNLQYQTLSETITRPYKQLPQITFDGEYNPENWNITLDNELTRFDHSDADTVGSTTIIGNRVRLKHALELEQESDGFFFKPRAQVRYLGYQLDNQALSTGANDAPSLVVPQAVVDSGLFFERDSSSYVQTFEPRLFYFYSPHKDQTNITGTSENINFDTGNLTFSYNQLFNDTRFSGGDRIDDANQLSLGLTTRFIGSESGRELFSAGVGKAFYLDERKVTLNGVTDTANNSPIAARLTAGITEHWSLNNDTIYNDDTSQVDDNNLSLKYRNGRALFNLGYRFLRNNVSANTIDQTELSIIQPFADNHWNIIAHTRYDSTNNRELEQLIGLEYNSCCYRTRVAYKRLIDDDQLTNNSNPIDYDTGIILEFQFIGLGGTGRQFDKLMNDTIDGYEQWQASYRQ